MAIPLVSVVMPVYNGERFLRESIESILNQTLTDFEFIIVNDGSTDTTASILANYQYLDPRIRIHHNENNKGIIASLNIGCQLAQGKYIARMDADDISLPERLKKQIDFLEINVDVGILGTSAEIIDVNGRLLQRLFLSNSPKVTNWHFLFGSRLIHPTVMMRRLQIKELNYYSPEAYGAEDYDLWERASGITRLTNLSDILFKYRSWGFSVTHKTSDAMEKRSIEIVQRTISNLLGYPIPIESAAHIRYLRDPKWGRKPQNIKQIIETKNLLTELHDTYSMDVALSSFEKHAISEDLALRYYRLMFVCARHSALDTVKIGIIAFRHSPLAVTQLVGKLYKTLL